MFPPRGGPQVVPGHQSIVLSILGFSRLGFALRRQNGRLDSKAEVLRLLQALFQSRTGFSGRLDKRPGRSRWRPTRFQSRAGFSGRLDKDQLVDLGDVAGVFQSRAGFSGRLDTVTR